MTSDQSGGSLHTSKGIEKVCMDDHTQRLHRQHRLVTRPQWDKKNDWRRKCKLHLFSLSQKTVEAQQESSLWHPLYHKSIHREPRCDNRCDRNYQLPMLFPPTQEEHVKVVHVHLAMPGRLPGRQKGWSHTSLCVWAASWIQPRRSTDLCFLSPGSSIIQSHVRGLFPVLCWSIKHGRVLAPSPLQPLAALLKHTCERTLSWWNIADWWPFHTGNKGLLSSLPGFAL